MTDTRSPIPITILTGFLGAGKTTLLNRILHADHGLRVAVLVNDFGAINIDNQLVVNVDEDTVSLQNGCICCTIRGDLLNALLGLVNRDDPPEYIIIEASGVSDPLEIALTFNMPELRGTITLDSVLTIIDAEQVLSLEGENRVLAILQVGAADIVAINKIDLVDDAQLQAVRQWTRQIIKEARIIETMHGTIPLEMILGVGAFDPLRLAQHDSHDVHVHTAGETHDHDHAHDHSMVFSTWSWESHEPLALKEIQRVISKLPPSVYRAKGVLYLADDPLRRGILQAVGKRASVDWGEAWGDQTPHSQIVVIGVHDSIEPDAYNAMFERCLAVHAPKTELHRLATTALSWLRGGG